MTDLFHRISPIFVSDPREDIRLIVNADDFGISESINRGIVQAHREGIVTATSLMAVGRAFDHAVRLHRLSPALDPGVHLTLVAEKPLLSGHNSLIGDDGRFPDDVGALLKKFLAGRIRLADIEKEWASQIEKLLDHGVRPTHLDSHQHVHALPGIARLALKLARRYRIPFVRVPMEDALVFRPLTRRGLTRRIGAMSLYASCMAAGLRRGTGESTPSPRFLGFQEGGRLDAANLRNLIRALQPGAVYELMCHPGFSPREPEVGRWNYRHPIELAALCDPAIPREIAMRKIHLCSFADLSRR